MFAWPTLVRLGLEATQEFELQGPFLQNRYMDSPRTGSIDFHSCGFILKLHKICQGVAIVTNHSNILATRLPFFHQLLKCPVIRSDLLYGQVFSDVILHA